MKTVNNNYVREFFNNYICNVNKIISPRHFFFKFTLKFQVNDKSGSPPLA